MATNWGDSNATSNLDPITRCENSLQSGCSECAANCRRIIPRLLNGGSASATTSGGTAITGNSGDAGLINNNNNGVDCGCVAALASAVANASAAGKVAPAVSSSKSLPRQNEESRRNASKLLCDRVCIWANEIIRTGRTHSGSCPAPHSPIGGSNQLLASKLSVRSPPQHEEYGTGRSEEMVESYLSDQPLQASDLLAGGEQSSSLWRSKPATPPVSASGCGFKSCDSDADCDWSERCCTSQDCSTRVCLQAVTEETEPTDGFKIVSFSLDSDQRIAKFNWVPSPSIDTSVPTMYLLELRYLIVPPSANGEQPLNEQSKDERMSEWMIVSNNSHSTSIHLDGSSIWPSTWYRFRVLRVSASSNIAVSQPVGPVKIAKELREVSEPRNITALQDQWYLNNDDPESVDGTITWLPPQISDIPITRYKIFYTQYVPSNVLAILSSPPEFKKSVPGHVTSIQLEQLIPETTYRVDIQAISRLPAVKLRSSKATVYIRTVALDEAGDPPGLLRRSTAPQPLVPAAVYLTKGYDISSEQDGYVASSAEARRLPAPVEGLTVGEVAYVASKGKTSSSSSENGRLEAVVSWTAPVRPTPTPSTGGENMEIFNDDDEDFPSQSSSYSQSQSKGSSPLRFIVEWAPLSCIQQEPSADSNQLSMAQAIRRLSLVTMNTSVTLHTLLPTCFYEVSVTTLDPTTGMRGSKQTQTFRTPLCGTPSMPLSLCNSAGDSGEVTAATTEPPPPAPPRRPTTVRPFFIDSESKSTQPSPTWSSSSMMVADGGAKEAPSSLSSSSSSNSLPTPAPVHNLQFKVVSDNGSILVQWDSTPTSPLLVPMELVFSWSVYPSLEPSAGQLRRLSPNRSRVIMQNLKPGLLYVVSVVSVARRQSDGELLKSPPARIVVLLPTPTAVPNSITDPSSPTDPSDINGNNNRKVNEQLTADGLSSSAPSSFIKSFTSQQSHFLRLTFYSLLLVNFVIDFR